MSLPSPQERHELGAGPEALAALFGSEHGARRAATVIATVQQVTAAHHPAMRAVYPASDGGAFASMLQGLEPAALRGARRTIAAAAVELVAPSDGPEDEAIVQRVAAALRFAPPLPVLLSEGGDDRQSIDHGSGENRYGTVTYPRPELLAYSSCTASDPTSTGFAAADSLRLDLLQEALLHPEVDALRQAWTRLRDLASRSLLGEEPGDVELVPTPSGTDAELLALGVALGRAPHVTVIIVAPGEVGSGTTAAATGRSFSSLTPNGDRREVGEELPGGARHVRAALVELRDARGEVRSAASVEREILGVIEDAAARGDQILLHVVEGSKTGLRAPRRSFVRAVKERFSEQIDVLVDAAQLRLSASELRAHLGDGAMVLVTGSKFVGGPPFSGGLLLTTEHRRRLAAGSSVDVTDFLDVHALPTTLSHLGRADRPPNVGLLLRWTAAVAELERYQGVDASVRRGVIDGLSATVRRALERSPELDDVTEWTADARGASATIASFRLGGGRSSDTGFAKEVHDAMRRPLDDSAVERHVGEAPQVQLGQPVSLGPEGAGGVALRLAIGAPLVAAIGSLPAEERSEALARERSHIESTVRKLTSVVATLG